MKVEIRFKSASQPTVFDDVSTTYTKDGLFCVRVEHPDGTVIRKYPLDNIFDIKETERRPRETITYKRYDLGGLPAVPQARFEVSGKKPPVKFHDGGTVAKTVESLMPLDRFCTAAGNQAAGKVATMLARLRETRPEMVKTFTEGGCFQLFLMLKAIYPDAECWYDGNHVYTRLYGYWWDINGCYETKPEYAELIDPEVEKRAYGWCRSAFWNEEPPMPDIPKTKDFSDELFVNAIARRNG